MEPRKRALRDLLDDDRGTTLVEYALIAVLVAGVCFAALVALGGQPGQLMSGAAQALLH